MSAKPERRAPQIADVRQLAQALQDHGVAYAVIGGVAMALHGFPRATKDIDLLLPTDPANNSRLLEALADIPAARAVLQDLKQEWLDQGFPIAADGEFSIDLLFVAAGHTFDELRPHIQTIHFDGIPVVTLDVDGLLMTKQTSRETDIPDRQRLRQLRDALKAARASNDRRDSE